MLCSCDENQELKFNQPQAPAQIINSKDALQIPRGPITRSRAQKLKEALIGLIQDILTAQKKSKIELKPLIRYGLKKELNEGDLG